MSQTQETRGSASRSAVKQPKQTNARRLSPTQLRARAQARIRALSDLTAELRRQCEETLAECAQLQVKLSSRDASPSTPGDEERPSPDCENCDLRNELARARAANARLSTDFVELLAFLEDISALLIPRGGAADNTASPRDTAARRETL